MRPRGNSMFWRSSMKLKTAWLCTVLACLILAVGVNTQAPYKAKRINRAIELLEAGRSEEHTSELQSLAYLVCRLLLEKKKNAPNTSPQVQQDGASPETLHDPRWVAIAPMHLTPMDPRSDDTPSSPPPYQTPVTPYYSIHR